MAATNLFMSYVNATWTPLPSGTALTFTLTPCINKGMPHKGASGKFADGSITLMGYAPNGQLDPLSFVTAV
jgi:hypothetical protein